jgi:DNA-directed RNA polymerase subunit RPC12/RpoP
MQMAASDEATPKKEALVCPYCGSLNFHNSRAGMYHPVLVRLRRILTRSTLFRCDDCNELFECSAFSRWGKETGPLSRSDASTIPDDSQAH